MITRRAAILLGLLWPFGRRAAAQPVPARRPDHVVDPRIGHRYWCVSQPYFRDRLRPVELPWRGEYVDAVLGPDLVYSRDPYLALKPSPRYLFRTRREAEAAIAWDWAHPPKDARAKIVLARDTLGRVERALRGARESRGLADGAVPGLMVVDMDLDAAQQLLATMALALDLQVYPQVERDQPAR